MIISGEEEFLADYCAKNKKYYHDILIMFKEYLEDHQVGSLQDMERIHVKGFSSFLNTKEWRKSTKNKRFNVIMLYLKFLHEYNFINKLLTIKRPNFSDFVSDKVAKKLSRSLPDRNTILQILAHAKKVHRKMYVLLVLLVHNGMRISELVSIKLSNVNLEERLLVTGLEKEHAKESICYYFIPAKFVIYLSNYIAELKVEYKDPIFLFPGSDSQRHLTITNAARNIAKYCNLLLVQNKIALCNANPHSFRHALNYERLKLGCNDSLLAILLNQVPKGSNAIYYLEMVKNNINIRKEFWEKFTPDYLS
jgi:site-specific recombinase XerD